MASDLPRPAAHPRGSRQRRTADRGTPAGTVAPSPAAGATETEPDARFTFANERTFLAWHRTALALVVAGLAIVAVPAAVSRRPVRPSPARRAPDRPRRGAVGGQLRRVDPPPAGAAARRADGHLDPAQHPRDRDHRAGRWRPRSSRCSPRPREADMPDRARGRRHRRPRPRPGTGAHRPGLDPYRHLLHRPRCRDAAHQRHRRRRWSSPSAPPCGLRANCPPGKRTRPPAAGLERRRTVQLITAATTVMSLRCAHAGTAGARARTPVTTCRAQPTRPVGGNDHGVKHEHMEKLLPFLA